MQEPPLRIRGYRPDDFEELLVMDRACFPPHIAFSRWELAFNLNHPESIARVADDSRRIVGFVLARMEGRSRTAHIITLDVAPEVRRKKIGTALMRFVHDELAGRGIRSVILEVSVQNVAALRLYEKFHYRRTCLLSGYYHGIEDAYQLKASIPFPKALDAEP
ncbi:MAG: GNAT family N-acetyltransferase [Acidobacteria bacterium]|nr:GNAT family N-acetyltransferase [Acidobacteriota bacterium]